MIIDLMEAKPQEEKKITLLGVVVRSIFKLILALFVLFLLLFLIIIVLAMWGIKIWEGFYGLNI